MKYEELTKEANLYKKEDQKGEKEMRVTKAILQDRVNFLESVVKNKNEEIEALKKALSFSPPFNFLTATMSTNKLARRMVEVAMDFRRGCKS